MVAWNQNKRFSPLIKFSNSQSDLHELGLNEFIPICIFFGKERAISLSGRFELRLRRTEIKQSCIISWQKPTRPINKKK